MTQPDQAGSLFDRLPDELLEHVLLHVGSRWLLSTVPAVCRRWRLAARKVPCRVVRQRRDLSTDEAFPETTALFHWDNTRQITDWLFGIARRSRLCGFPEDSTIWDDDNLEAMIELCPHLQLYGMKGSIASYKQRDSLRIARALAARCPDLRTVSLFGVDPNDNVIATLAQGCRAIHTFSCQDFFYNDSDMGRITDAAVLQIAAHCSRLTQLYFLFLPKNESITDQSLTAVARGCPRLSRVVLHGLTTLTDAVLLALAKGCPELTRVMVVGGSFTDDGVIPLLVGCRKLETVRFEGAAVTDASLIAVVEHAPTITRLEFLKAPHLTDAGLAVLVKAGRRFAVLHVNGPNISDEKTKI